MTATDTDARSLYAKADMCSRCGFCRAVCPPFKATGRAAHGGRGKIFILREILAGREPADAELVRTLFQCTLCGHCAATCPVNLDPADLLKQSRDYLLRAGLAPTPIRTVIEAVKSLGNPLGRQTRDRTKLLTRWPAAQPGDKVVYWPGCREAYEDDGILAAAGRLMQAGGRRLPVPPAGTGCCGYPLYLAGDETTLLHLARANVEALKSLGVERLVMSCPGCLRTFHRIYPDLGLEPPEAIHLSQWLMEEDAAGIPAWREDRPPVRVTYHDPCDLGRHLGIFEPPRRLLSSLPWVTFTELPTNRTQSLCCGGGGGLPMVDPDLALAIAGKRVEQALALEVELLVTACPSCKQNLDQAAARLRGIGRIDDDFSIVDLSELLARYLSG